MFVYLYTLYITKSIDCKKNKKKIKRRIVFEIYKVYKYTKCTNVKTNSEKYGVYAGIILEKYSPEEHLGIFGYFGYYSNI